MLKLLRKLRNISRPKAGLAAQLPAATALTATRESAVANNAGLIEPGLIEPGLIEPGLIEPMLMEELEPRILHSADLSPLHDVDVLAPLPEHEQSLPETADVEPAALSENASQSTELVFVDTATPDYQILLDDLTSSFGTRRNFEILLIDSDSDGIEQITEAVAERSNIEAIHIVSHGSEGELALGTGRLTFESMTGEHAGALAAIGESLSDTADILVYGCNFGQGELGRQATEELARLTGADVAASDDLTGHASLGGDWDLEYAAGQIETGVAFGGQAQQNWMNVLTWLDPNTGAPTGGPTNLADLFVGDATDDTGINALNGDDVLYGNDGNDILYGGGGDDLIVGGSGNNELYGENGDDILIGGAGDDILDGGTNLDILIAGGGSDTMNGGGDDDLFLFTGAQHGDVYTVDGGALFDRIDVSEFGVGNVTFPSGTQIRVELGGGDFFLINHSNVENIIRAEDGGNHTPQADAGPDQSVDLSSLVTLDASASSDPDPDTLTFEWQQIGGTWVTLSSTTAVSPTFTAPGSADVLTFAVTVSDGSIYKNVDIVEITVRSDLTVTTATDVSDGDTSSISNLISTPGADGFISLREAITAANNTTNGVTPDLIRFSIAGGGVQTIQLTSALPDITDAVILDATTQPGFAGTPIIELDGTLATGASGLSVTGGGSTISGLVINRFDGYGIVLSTGGNNTIQGNYIGTNVAGDTALGNANDGIHIEGGSSNNLIGGSTAAARNIVSANDDGIAVAGPGTSGNVIKGNYIGTNAAGTAALGNVDDGIVIYSDASNTTIGGDAPGEGNLVSGNGSDGIQVGSATTTVSDITIQGNLIGTDATGTSALANTQTGIDVEDGTNILIGGISASAGNTIAFNNVNGIEANPGINSSLLSNTIFANTGLGIDRDVDGVTLNDAGDADAVQNYPVLTSALTDVSSIIIDGSLNSKASTTFRIEFFASAAADATGYGEGETYLGFTTVTTDGAGNATFSTPIAAAVPAGQFITATATEDLGGGNYGDTSEFAQNVVATASSINDAPIVAAPAAPLAAAEQTPLAVHGSGFEVKDIDEAGGGALATLSVGEGNITVVEGDSGVVITGGNGSSSVTLAGTIAEINNLLTGAGTGTITYLNNADAPNASTILTVTVNDQGNTGTDPGLTGDAFSEEGSASVSIKVTGANDAPVFTSSGPYTVDENAPAGTVVGTVIATDPDVQGAGASLIISEIMYDPASTEPRWEWIEVYNPTAATIDLAGYVLDDINSIAHAAANIAGGSVAPGSTAVLFDADQITAADFEAAWASGINLIAVTGWADLQLNNDGDTVSLWASFADYSGDHLTHANALVTVTYDDVAPWPAPDGAASIYLNNLSADPADGSNWALSTVGAITPLGSLAYQSTSTASNSGADIGSPGDGGSGTNLVYTITGNVNPDGDANPAFTIDSGTGVITVNDPDDLDYETNSSLAITVEVTDGTDLTSTLVTINLNNVNEAPSVTAPASISVTEDVASAITGISFADVDAGAGSMTATFSVAQGSLAATSGGGVTVGGSATNLTLTGSIADINTFIGASNLTYTTALNDTSPVNLAVSINDGGNSGSGGALSSPLSNVTLNVSAVNDAPTLSSFAAAVDSVAEDTEAEITFAEIAAQGDEADVDGTVDAFVIKAVSSGTLKIGASAATATPWAAGSNDIIDATNNAYWTPANDANGTLNAFTAVARDNSGAESGTAVQAQVTVTAVNDAPSVTAPASITVTEDVASAITGISFADVDAGAASVTTTFSVAQGTLAATSGGGVTVGGTAANLTLTGTLTDINAFISASNLTYTTALNDTSAVNLAVSVNDGGNSGSGGALSSPLSNVTLNVNAVNDAPTGTVSVTGTAAEDQVLTASNTLADADGLGTISYQWQRDGTDIAGATANSYTLVDADVGTNIAVVASYTDAGGTLESVASAAVGPVANVNDAPSGSANIAGTVALGQILTADTSSISDGDGLGPFSYQWRRDGLDIAGANSGTYTLMSDDIGATISVRVSYVDGGGTPESVNSVVVGPVADTLIPPDAPTTSGPEAPETNNPPADAPPPVPPAGDPVATAPAGEPSNSTGAVPPSGGVAVSLDTILGSEPSENGAAPATREFADSQPARQSRITAAGTGFDLRYFALEQLESALDEVTFIVAPSVSLPSFGSGVHGIDAPEFFQELDRLRDNAEEQTRSSGTLVTSNLVATAGLSVGYLFWLLRTEVLIGSLLSSLPAWRLVDPLPVLGRLVDDDEDDDDSLESLVERKNRAAEAVDEPSLEAS